MPEPEFKQYASPDPGKHEDEIHAWYFMHAIYKKKVYFSLRYVTNYRPAFWHVPTARIGYDNTAPAWPQLTAIRVAATEALKREWPAAAKGKLGIIDLDTTSRCGGKTNGIIHPVVRVAVDQGKVLVLRKIEQFPGQKLPYKRHAVIWVPEHEISRHPRRKWKPWNQRTSPFCLIGKKAVRIARGRKPLQHTVAEAMIKAFDPSFINALTETTQRPGRSKRRISGITNELI